MAEKIAQKKTAPKKVASASLEAIVYGMNGKETGTVTLPEAVFGLPWNSDLVHQVTVAMQANARTPVAHTKGRGEVRGGGKKPWRQKGTGRARHGSTRSPIWRGGGITFGPRNDKDYTQKLNKKMKAKALFTVLSRKMKDGEIIFVDAVSFKAPKAADAKKTLDAFSKIKGFETMLSKKTNAALVAVHGNDSAIKKSFNNFKNIEVDEVRNLNPVDVLRYKYLVLSNPKETFAVLESKSVIAGAKK